MVPADHADPSFTRVRTAWPWCVRSMYFIVFGHARAPEPRVVRMAMMPEPARFCTRLFGEFWCAAWPFWDGPKEGFVGVHNLNG